MELSNATPGHIPRQNCNSKRYMHLYVHNSTIYNSQDMRKILMSINSWMDKEVVRYIHTHTHTHTQWYITQPPQEWNNVICSNMNGPRDYNTKQSQKEKDKYHYVESNIWHKWTYLQNRNRLTDTDLSLSRGMDGEGWMDSKFGICKSKLLYIFMYNWITLLYTETNTAL